MSEIIQRQMSRPRQSSEATAPLEIDHVVRRAKMHQPRLWNQVSGVFSKFSPDSELLKEMPLSTNSLIPALVLSKVMPLGRLSCVQFSIPSASGSVFVEGMCL